MSNKAAKALIFFVIAIIAFMVSYVCAVEAYNIIVDASMQEEYSNPDNVTIDNVSQGDYGSNNNHYYSNNNTLDNGEDNNESSLNMFDMNILDLFNSSGDSGDDSNGGVYRGNDSNSDSSDISSFASNVFEEIKNRVKEFFGNF